MTRRLLALAALLGLGSPGAALAQPAAAPIFASETVFLPLAARTTTTSTAWYTNGSARGLLVYLNTTAVTATPTVAITVELWDPVSAAPVVYQTFLDQVDNVELTKLGLWPDQITAANSQITEKRFAPIPLGARFRFTFTAADADSATYSLVGWPVP